MSIWMQLKLKLQLLKQNEKILAILERVFPFSGWMKR